MKQYFPRKFKAIKDYKKIVCNLKFGEAQICPQSSKKNLKLNFRDSNDSFLQPKIYLQMGLFFIFMYFTIILEKFTRRLRHRQLAS